MRPDPEWIRGAIGPGRNPPPGPLKGWSSADSRQREVKGGAVVRVRGGPQAAAVSLDDRPADRQPHAEPARLRGVERVEEPVGLEPAEADAAVLHRDDRARAIVDELAGRPDVEAAPLDRDLSHRLGRVDE